MCPVRSQVEFYEKLKYMRLDKNIYKIILSKTGQPSFAF